MKVSVITVSYNSSLTIRDTIESVLNQTFDDIEYIIVDGKSDDNTVDIIKEYELSFGSRLRWISESDNGLYHAMNKGISMATGEVVSLLNSDDMICEIFAIEHVVRTFQENVEIDAVYANLLFVERNNTNIITRKWIVGNQKPMKTGWDVAHPTFYVRKGVYEKYGVFDLDYRLSADFELILRFLDIYKIRAYYLNEFIVKMRVGGETSKNIKNFILQNDECLSAFKKHKISINKYKYLLMRLIPKLFQLNILK
jgi:glycosyltransferase involved in cell wall biosynthesis